MMEKVKKAKQLLLKKKGNEKQFQFNEHMDETLEEVEGEL